MLWHRLLCLLRLRNDYDYSPPADTWAITQAHPYEPHVPSPPFRHPDQGIVIPEPLRCCARCGGGRWHRIHQVVPLGQKDIISKDQWPSEEEMEQFRREAAEMVRRQKVQ